MQIPDADAIWEHRLVSGRSAGLRRGRPQPEQAGRAVCRRWLLPDRRSGTMLANQPMTALQFAACVAGISGTAILMPLLLSISACQDLTRSDAMDGSHT